jgi:peptide/nickel transport system ATP-binding protein
MLEARDIQFAYPGQAPLVDGFNLKVLPHERLALDAPSGVGKSTLCKLLAGYLKAHKGSVCIDGAPVPDKGVCPIQLIWQHPEQALNTHVRMKKALEEAGATDENVCERLGIRTLWLSRYPHELSGGELQRFCIARALAAQPRYLIADEISTMLDAVTQAHIWQVLQEECTTQGIGLIFVSHSPALTARIATRRITL